MKFLLLAAAVVSVAVAGPTRSLVPLPVVIDEYEPIHVGPAIVDEYEPIHVGPAIIDEYEPIHVGPAIVDEYQPPHVEPVLVDFPLPESALAPTPASAPLVQIIVNVKQPAAAAPGSPVQVVDAAEEKPVDVIVPTPVIVVDEAEVPDYEPVLVMEPTFPVAPEPVIVAPVIVAPAVVAPEILN